MSHAETLDVVATSSSAGMLVREIAAQVELLDIGGAADRSLGDVHPLGNDDDGRGQYAVGQRDRS